MNTLGPRGLFMYRLLGTCMIIWALECSFACCETGTRVFIHLYHYMHWAIIGVPCSVYMNMEIISWVCIYFYHFKMLSNYDDMLTTTLITISTFRCSMPVNINMKKASTHSFLWTSFNLYAWNTSDMYSNLYSSKLLKLFSNEIFFSWLKMYSTLIK